MELHPILEHGVSPNSGLWYVLSALGDYPSCRVGLTCTHIPGPEGTNGKVYVIGGANPSTTFLDTYVLDLETFSWDTLDCDGLKARYEHAAFVPESQPDKIYVFGGADQSGNHNDLQVLDISSKKWTTVTPRGTAPCKRTYHTTACAGDRFIVYSGGHCGSEPVPDKDVFAYDATANEWSVLKTKGDPPKRRHGHVTVAVGNKIYVHGGMSGNTFYDDLHVLDLTTCTWNFIKKKNVPTYARAAHGVTAFGTSFYVFGGMNQEGALDDMFKFDTVSQKWSKVELEGPPPTCRLDFGICSVSLKVPLVSSVTQDDIMASQEHAKDVLQEHLRTPSGSTRSRTSSASSGRSACSAGSPSASPAPRSRMEELGFSANADGTGEPAAEGATMNQIDLLSEALPDDRQENQSDQEYRTVQLCLVIAGMDTEGNIFDDSLVYVVTE